MNSLSARLLAGFLLVITLTLAVIGVALLLILRDNPLVDRVPLTRLNEAARAAIEQEFLQPDQPPESWRVKARRIATTYGVRVLVTNNQGGLIFDSHAPNEPPLNFVNFDNARQDNNLPNALTGRVRDSNKVIWTYVARPFGARQKLIFAEPAPTYPVLNFFLENLFWPLLQAGGAAALVALGLAIWLARSIAQPLQQMAQAAHQVAQGNYAHPAPETGPTEVQDLGRTFNQMARQVQATQQAQRDFLANVSHDLKTPLTSIQGFAQAMLDGAVDTPDGVQRAATIIFDESDRMRRLVESLLDLARLDAGLKTLHKRPLDLLPFLRALTEPFQLQATTKNLTLNLELPPTLPAILGDADPLARVFNNLLENALKHTPAGGQVTLRAAPSTATHIEITVSDTGPGIPPEDLPRVFERFYQVDKARSRGRGAGLGLTISKEIIEAHQGQIWATSAPGNGATFHVRLPTLKPDDPTLVRKRKTGG